MAVNSSFTTLAPGEVLPNDVTTVDQRGFKNSLLQSQLPFRNNNFKRNRETEMPVHDITKYILDYIIDLLDFHDTYKNIISCSFKTFLGLWLILNPFKII
jgi:hypothetical protein